MTHWCVIVKVGKNKNFTFLLSKLYELFALVYKNLMVNDSEFFKKYTKVLCLDFGYKGL